MYLSSSVQMYPDVNRHFRRRAIKTIVRNVFTPNLKKSNIITKKNFKTTTVKQEKIQIIKTTKSVDTLVRRTTNTALTSGKHLKT